MKRTIIKTLLVALAVFAQISFADFVEIDGQVVMEAENYQSNTPDAANATIVWQVLNQGTGLASTAGDASGGEYLHLPANPANGTYTIGEGALTSAARVSYKIEIKTGGTYYIWTLGAWPEPTGTNGNSYWFSVGTAVGQYCGIQNRTGDGTAPNVWGWWSQGQDTGRSIALTPGKYTFSLHQREGLVCVDKIILTLNSTATNPFTGFGPDETIKRGLAHSPVPADQANEVDSESVAFISWYSPKQFEDGSLDAEPNIANVNRYKVWFGTHEPNEVTDTPTVTTAQSISVTLTYDTTYYWRVDPNITWDSNDITGTINEAVEGTVWKFTTLPEYVAPVLTFQSEITTQALLPAALAASITNNSDNITSVVFTLLTDDVEYPAGAVASVTNTTTNNQNPAATLSTNTAGRYKVKLVISDGTTTLEKIAEVLVYEDACAAKKASPSGWTANYYDRDSTCLVNLSDFAVLAQNWLNDTTMKAQETYTGASGYPGAL
jgi:hypothetical protein